MAPLDAGRNELPLVFEYGIRVHLRRVPQRNRSIGRAVSS
jgi:hypothetical protein